MGKYTLCCCVGSLILAAVTAHAQVRPADLTKKVIERGPERLVERVSVETAPSSPQAAKPPAQPTIAKVAPGHVPWHADWSAACDAAGGSNRPVLLFQLLGQLDEEFT